MAEPKTRNEVISGMNADQATLHGDEPPVDTSHAAALKVSRLRGKALKIAIGVVAGTGFTLFGYDQGVMSALLTTRTFEETFPQTVGTEGNAPTLQSLLVAIYEIGCLAGALSNLYVGDKLGRRHTITLGGAIMIVGAILQTAAIDYPMMIVARVVTGVGNGLLTSTVPAYQSECAPAHQRGLLVLVEGSLITFGIMLSYWIDLGFYFTTSSIQWRFPIAIQILFAVAMIGGMYGLKLPESPRYLVRAGKNDEALAVLAALADAPVTDPEVLQTWRGICDVTAIEGAHAFKFGELLTHGKTQNFRRTMIGILAQCFQQICGINLITYYLTTVLERIGLDPELSRIISGVNGTCYFLTSLVGLALIERVGRRPLMLWTAILQCFTMAILAGLYELTQAGNKAAQVVSVLMLFLFNTWFSVGWLGMTWLYPAELTGLRIRAPANALSTASNWTFNFLVVMITGPAFANIRWATYLLFTISNGFIIFPAVYFFFPETKGYSLEDLDLVFAKAHDEGVSPVKVARYRDIPKAGSREAERVLGRTESAKEKSAPVHREEA